MRTIANKSSHFFIYEKVFISWSEIALEFPNWQKKGFGLSSIFDHFVKEIVYELTLYKKFFLCSILPSFFLDFHKLQIFQTLCPI